MLHSQQNGVTPPKELFGVFFFLWGTLSQFCTELHC